MKGSLELLRSVVEFPLYMYVKQPTGIACDKLKFREGKIQRVRYLIHAKKQCTCISFAKVEKCKHLKMLQDDFSFLPGVDREEALEELEEVKKTFGRQFPESVDKWILEDVPEKVAAVYVPLEVPKIKGAFKVVSIIRKKFALVFMPIKTED